VYEGTLDGSRVCLKRVRVYTRDSPEKATKVCHWRCHFSCFPSLTNLQTFCQEAVMWKRLKHPNIVSLLGITVAPLQLISEWMAGGDLPEYITKHSDTDRLGLVGVPPVQHVYPTQTPFTSYLTLLRASVTSTPVM